MSNEIIKFVSGNLQLNVNVSPDKETFMLFQKQMADSFSKGKKLLQDTFKIFSNQKNLIEIQYAHILSILFQVANCSLLVKHVMPVV